MSCTKVQSNIETFQMPNWQEVAYINLKFPSHTRSYTRAVDFYTTLQNPTHSKIYSWTHPETSSFLYNRPCLQVLVFSLMQSRICKAGNLSQAIPQIHQAENILREHTESLSSTKPTEITDSITHRCDQRKLLCIAHPVTITQTPSEAETQSPGLSYSTCLCLNPRHACDSFIPLGFPWWVFVNLMSSFHRNVDGWSPGKCKGVVKTICQQQEIYRWFQPPPPCSVPCLPQSLSHHWLHIWLKEQTCYLSQMPVVAARSHFYITHKWRQQTHPLVPEK